MFPVVDYLLPANRRDSIHPDFLSLYDTGRRERIVGLCRYLQSNHFLTFCLVFDERLDSTLPFMNHTSDHVTSDTERIIDRLFNPTVLFISLNEASQLLGIAKSTAHKAVKETGELCPGVPVKQVSNTRRFVVSTAHLRSIYGANNPQAGIDIENTFLP
jgi:hypothetical protein